MMCIIDTGIISVLSCRPLILIVKSHRNVENEQFKNLVKPLKVVLGPNESDVEARLLTPPIPLTHSWIGFFPVPQSRISDPTQVFESLLNILKKYFNVFCKLTQRKVGTLCT
jgi:hypothetical protein